TTSAEFEVRRKQDCESRPCRASVPALARSPVFERGASDRPAARAWFDNAHRDPCAVLSSESIPTQSVLLAGTWAAEQVLFQELRPARRNWLVLQTADDLPASHKGPHPNSRYPYAHQPQVHAPAPATGRGWFPSRCPALFEIEWARRRQLLCAQSTSPSRSRAPSRSCPRVS